MKILGFFHIFLENHWEEIVQEQIKAMTDSYLVDKAEVIHIGALGPVEQMQRLMEILKPHPKFRISHASTNTQEYEFCTLDLLQKAAKADPPFLAFYIHTKGASYPKTNERAYIGGNYWRQYMNYYNLIQWKEVVNKLQVHGYDTCGVKLLTQKDGPAHRLHYSGNFFWAKSTYINTLADISQLRQQNRYEAEFWIGGGHPVAATCCQDFVDYNTQKYWENPK